MKPISPLVIHITDKIIEKFVIVIKLITSNFFNSLILFLIILILPVMEIIYPTKGKIIKILENKLSDILHKIIEIPTT
jgi:hypothetical protein